MSKPKEYLSIPLTKRFTDQEIKRLRSFRARFQELWSNFDDLKSSGLNFDGHHIYDINNIIKTSVDLGVSRFRIKGVLVDYRHFYGQGEPSNFQSILNIIKRCCQDHRLIEVIDRNKNEWGNAGTIAGWHNDFTLDEIVDAVFKEDVFHTDRHGKEIKVWLEDVSAKLSPEAIWYEMTHMAYSRMLIIGNIDEILDPVFSEKNEIRIPH